MKKKLLMVIFMHFSGAAFSGEMWFSDDWKVKKLICPFECNKPLKSFYKVDEKVQLYLKTYKIPSFNSSCKDPNKANWSNIKQTKLAKHLNKWTQNKKAIERPAVRAKLSSLLNLTESTTVWAGIVTCSDGHSFNLIYVSPKKAFILFEENSFWELYK